MHHYCTYFDHRFLPQGLALYSSLRKHCTSFRLWILCMDPLVYRILFRLSLPDLTLIRIQDLENADPQLANAKQNRGLLDYYFTCTPSLPLFVLSRHLDVPMITYLDADLFFFSNPAPLYAEIADSTIAIIAHRFPERLRHLEIYGAYNVGWLTFTRNDESFNALLRWREQCIEWCSERHENHRYADQKYLDDWPALYKNLVVLRHKGANLAPWNLANYEIGWHDSRVWVDDQPLIFYHFHGLHPLANWFYDSQLDRYQVKPSLTLMRRVYLPYIQSLKRQPRHISFPTWSGKMIKNNSLHELHISGPRRVSAVKERTSLRRVLHISKGLLTRKYLFAAGNCIL